jgi:basic membrane lipoprotein Med (substrate-binding protein (PBP1-ABC) superfamily)
MKKSMTVIGALLFASVIFTSCGGGVESDAKKLADLMCKAQKLMQDGNTEEYEAISKEGNELEKELKGKYTSEEDQKKFVEALTKEIANCK